MKGVLQRIAKIAWIHHIMDFLKYLQMDPRTQAVVTVV